MDFPNDNVTCISPWYELRINHDGSYSYCHAARVKDRSSLTPVEWFRNGELVSQARTYIKTGVELNGCKECYHAETLGLVSNRNRRNFQSAIFSGEFFKESLIQSPSYNTLTGNCNNIKPAFIHVSLSNLCNLACRTCQPHNSSKLVNVFKRAKIIDSSTPVHLEWTNDIKKWDSFVDLVINNPNLTSLHFMGGEPLLHNRFYKLVDLCIAENKTNFHLTFVSNGTVFDSSLIEKLKKFKSVHVEISVENFHKTNNYIRLGSDVTQIKNNVKLFADYRNENFTVVLRTVPQALSIQHYDTIIDFAIEHQLTIDSNIIHNPEYLKIYVLPSALKNEIIQHISEKYKNLLGNDFSNLEAVSYIRNNSGFLKSISAHLKSIIALLNEKEPENIDVLRAQFIEFNKKLDLVSGFEFNELYPEIVF